MLVQLACALQPTGSSMSNALKVEHARAVLGRSPAYFHSPIMDIPSTRRGSDKLR